jgi:indolepyruvate ferredoxin oxidoreductase
MLDAAFPMLAKLKGLRGTPLDLFGHTAERKLERRLIGDYQAGVEKLLAGLTPERLATAVKIASIPQQIRGFGHVKEASLKPARVEEALLWKEWENLAAKEAVPA